MAFLSLGQRRTDLALWWLQADDAAFALRLAVRANRAAGDHADDTPVDAALGLPPYLAARLVNCASMAPRGRIWAEAAMELPLDSIFDHPQRVWDRHTAYHLARGHGIALWRADADAVAGLPGALVDLDLVPLRPLPAPDRPRDTGAVVRVDADRITLRFDHDGSYYVQPLAQLAAAQRAGVALNARFSWTFADAARTPDPAGLRFVSREG